jgi:hypothetical protein
MRDREQAINALGRALWPHKGDISGSPSLRTKVETLIDAYEALPEVSLGSGKLEVKQIKCANGETVEWQLVLGTEVVATVWRGPETTPTEALGLLLKRLVD